MWSRLVSSFLIATIAVFLCFFLIMAEGTFGDRLGFDFRLTSVLLYLVLLPAYLLELFIARGGPIPHLLHVTFIPDVLFITTVVFIVVSYRSRKHPSFPLDDQPAD